MTRAACLIAIIFAALILAPPAILLGAALFVCMVPVAITELALEARRA